MVCRELSKLKNCISKQGSCQIVWFGDIELCIHQLKFVGAFPSRKGSVKSHSIFWLCRHLDHTSTKFVYNLGKVHIQLEIYDQQRNDSCSYNEKNLDCINIQQSLDASCHSVYCTYHSQNDCRIYYELKVNGSERHHRYSNCRNEKTAAGCEELSKKEHYRSCSL